MGSSQAIPGSRQPERTLETAPNAVLGLTNRTLPYLPRTWRVHSLLVVVIVPFVFAIAVHVIPKTTKEQREFDESRRRTPAAQADEERQSRVKLDCEVYVRQRLQVPSTADFSPSAKLSSREDGGYLVRGWVEAQNAFGAKFRRQYDCAIDGSGQVISGRTVE